jgi:WhiB family redox-sensing transcriptional regulator
MTAVMSALDWQRNAACEGMSVDLFFPESTDILDDRVIRICTTCPIKELCRDWAIVHDEYGVWGGLTDSQRAQVNTTRSRVRCPDCRSEQVIDEGGTEVCLSCGLSWPV